MGSFHYPLMSDSLKSSRLSRGRVGFSYCQPEWISEKNVNEQHRCNSGSLYLSAVQTQPDVLLFPSGCPLSQSPSSNSRINGTALSNYVTTDCQLAWPYSTISDVAQPKDGTSRQSSPDRYIQTSFHKIGHGMRGTATGLLPPIDFNSTVKHRSRSRLRSKGLDTANEGSFSPTSYSYHRSCSTSRLQDVHANRPSTSDAPDVSCPRRRSVFHDGFLMRNLLHKTSRTQELRPQTVETWNNSRFSPYTAVTAEPHLDSSGLADRGVRHPITPPSRKSRLRLDQSSSQESIEQAQLTTLTSPPRPRLITISPRTPSSNASSQPVTPQDCGLAVVSAVGPLSPETESKTSAVTNQIEGNDDHPTCLKHDKPNLRTLDGATTYPITPLTSRHSTPICITTPLCFQTGSRRVQSTMTHYDHPTVWILQELEALMAKFPTTSLRLGSPVIKRIRSTSSSSVVSDAPSLHRSIAAPHSRFSPYKFSTSHPRTFQNPPPSLPSSPAEDSSANALRIVFPTARIHALESLLATLIAFHFVSNFPPPEPIPSSAPGSARSSYIPLGKPSRSSSLLSDIPPKARQMLGLVDSPLLAAIPVAPQGKSGFRSRLSEPDTELTTRLENMKLLLESSVRKILVDIEGRALEKRDDALVRAIGEVVRLGERRQ